MPASPCQRPQDETTAPRSPRSTTTLIAVLIAAETAVCTTATNAEQPLVAPIVPPAPVCEGTPMTAPTAAVSNSPIDALDDELRRKVCSFLNWRECLDLKPLNKAWNAASEDVVRMDVLPDTTTPTPAVFLTCPSGLVADAPVEALLRCQHPSKWRCAMCGFCNSETRILCGNRACQIPCPTHRDCARLFLGQLRREGTVGTLKWLVESVLGDPKTNPVTIVNIENHRQLTTSRGKGCAWVYLQHRSMADAVLGHNHRAFFDVHPVTGREGVWIVGAGAEAALQECVKVRGYVRGRDLLLPRNALVVEYPSRQPNQSWASSSSSLPYATSSPTTAVAPAMPTSAGKGSATPDSNWYPATDSPPSESSTENHIPSSTSPTHAARGRRHQPYGTPNAWTPTAAGMPSLPPGEFPQLPPQMATTTGYLETTDAYFQHPDYDAYYATYYTAQPTGHRHRGWRAAYHGQQHMYTTAYYPQQAMYATATY